MDNRAELEDELNELEQHHRRLDDQISKGFTNYLDDASLGKIKQEKLVIKREIENLRTKLGL